MILADINEQKAQETAEESSKFATNPDFRAIAISVDVTDPTSVQHMIDIAFEEFGRVDYNVNTAGVSAVSSILFRHCLSFRLILFK